MNRLIPILLGGLLLTTCTHRWTAIPQDVPSYEDCKPLSSAPQMLKVQGTSSSYIIVEDCLFMDRERVSIGLKTFLQKWKERFPQDIFDHESVERALDTLLVTFSDEEKTANAYTGEGVYGENFSLAGLTLSPGWIWVKITPGDRLCKTSFAHELVHVAIWSINKKHGDPDHLGSKYSGWSMDHNILIQDINKIWCDWGL
jgi:hypothetical protein